MSTAVNSLSSLSSGLGGQIPFQSSYQTLKASGKLAEALAKAQADFRPVPKTKTAKINANFSYKYADLSDVLGMAVPVLAKHGIAFSQPIRRDGDRMFVVTRIQLGDEFLEDAGLPVPSQVKPQEMGTYITYARRYGVSTFLGIAADEDTDAQETREDKPSTSGQNVRAALATSEKATEAVSGKNEFVKRGRPAVLKESTTVPKVSAVVAPEPLVQTTPPIANDSDIPSNIGSRPTMDEMKIIKARLNSFELDKDALKKYVLSKTGRENAGQLTKNEWDEVLTALDAAKATGGLADLVK